MNTTPAAPLASLSLLELTLAVAPILIAVWLIARGIRGRTVPGAAACRRCRYDLRSLDGVWERCPECGADLGKGAGVRFGRARARPLVAALGVVMLALVPPGLVATKRALEGGMARWRAHAALREGAELTREALEPASNEVLLAELPAQWARISVWNEVDRRRRIGRIDDVAVRRALVAGLDANPTPFGAPMRAGGKVLGAWCRDGLLDPAMVRRIRLERLEIVHALPASALVGETVPFRIEVLSRSDPSRVLAVRVETFELVEVTAAGAVIPAASAAHDDPRAHGVTGSITVDLPPGTHELRFVIDLNVDDQGYRMTDQPPLGPTVRREFVTSITVLADDEPAAASPSGSPGA